MLKVDNYTEEEFTFEDFKSIIDAKEISTGQVELDEELDEDEDL